MCILIRAVNVIACVVAATAVDVAVVVIICFFVHSGDKKHFFNIVFLKIVKFVPIFEFISKIEERKKSQHDFQFTSERRK